MSCEHVVDNQGCCHHCGILMERDKWEAFAGEGVPHASEKFAVMGWNDRVAKTSEDYGKAYLSRGGPNIPREYVANHRVARKWSVSQRAEYVRGWEAASKKIASLRLPGGG